VDQQTVLIISDNQADQLILAECLARAIPHRFRLADPAIAERPLEALMDPDVDVVIMACAPQAEYLLRLAVKNGATAPIVLLVDEANETTFEQLRDLGAQDYLVRGQLQDALVHRVLDYNGQLKQAREALKQLSGRDTLTGALNRVGFRANVERAIERSQRYGFQTAILYINIDQFGAVNDHYGETAGDEMIRAIARRLLSKLRSTDSIARLGGDEFAVVLEDVSSAEDVEFIAGKMLRSISAPMTLGEHSVTVDASIGAALYPQDADEFPPLVECARTAMQEAKTTDGGRLIRYSDSIAFNVAGKAFLAAELRTAVRQNQFELHYQPRVDLESGCVRGVEALLRWNHPERGLLCPGEFITGCEDLGLMKVIGYQVIQHACTALKWLDQQGMNEVDVAVNISFSQIQEDRFVEIVKDIVTRSGADISRLEFELTESAILKDPSAIKARMDELCETGISFSLDDFGTGFSQLSHLTELPISVLKIDAHFLSEVPNNAQQEAVCSMIIEMARRLGMLVIAEGAETHEQVEFLRQHQCPQVQGFYFSPAMPLQQLPRFVSEQRFKGQEQLAH
jgi:diguanylate cyclase (GGDEF)-like protein